MGFLSTLPVSQIVGQLNVEQAKLNNLYEEEIQLVQQAIAGDNEAFSQLMEKHREKIYRVLYFIVHNEDDAMDLLQDTFVKAYKSLDRLNAPGAFYKWLVRIATNLALNAIKRKECIKKHQERLCQEYKLQTENPQDVIAKKELREKVAQMVAKLPAKQRTVLVLCDIEGYSYKEIAEILKCRIGTVMSRIHYARAQLRANIIHNPTFSTLI